MRKILLPIVAISATFFASCEHDTFKPVGGKGGSAQLIVYPRHHGVTETLDSMVVYIKYDAADAPANGRYDDSAFCDIKNNQPTCTFSNLWNGNYYLYARGVDYALPAPGYVKGGLRYTVTAQQSISISIPVGEE